MKRFAWGFFQGGLWGVLAGCFVATVMLMVIASCSCVMIVNYAPKASRASLYAHEQSASNMIVSQDIPVTAQMAHELTGIAGAQFKGNTVKGIETTTKLK